MLNFISLKQKKRKVANIVVKCEFCDDIGTADDDGDDDGSNSIGCCDGKVSVYIHSVKQQSFTALKSQAVLSASLIVHMYSQ